MCTNFKKVFIEFVTVLVLFYVLFISVPRHVGSQLPVVVAQSPGCVPLFVTPWTAAHQVPCSSLSPRVGSNSCSLSRWCYLTISSSTALFSFCLQSFTASGSALHIGWPKYWSFSFNNNPSNECSGWISFRIDWFDHCIVQGTLKSLLQHHNLKTPVLQHSAFMVRVSHPFVHDYWKNYSFEYMDLCCQSDVSDF